MLGDVVRNGPIVVVVSFGLVWCGIKRVEGGGVLVIFVRV